MEGMSDKSERGSLVERKSQAAFSEVVATLNERLSRDLGSSFESNGREYDLTGPEDCMVAYAQQLRVEMRKLHDEVQQKDDYYQEKATAKLIELFRAYERLVSLFAELRTQYPAAAESVRGHIPVLDECLSDGQAMWEAIKDKQS